MVRYFDILGQKVGSHVLAMLTLGTTAGISYLGLRGDGSKATTPPIQASSGDEEKFIRDFLAKVEAEEKATAKH